MARQQPTRWVFHLQTSVFEGIIDEGASLVPSSGGDWNNGQLFPMSSFSLIEAQMKSRQGKINAVFEGTFGNP